VGSAIRAAGRYAEAEPWLRQALARAEREGYSFRVR
jgi:hypothetical protein